MILASLLAIACFAPAGKAMSMGPQGKQLLFLEDAGDRAAGMEEGDVDGVVLGVDAQEDKERLLEDLLGDKPKKGNVKEMRRRLQRSLTASLDEIIPLLEVDFKDKTLKLKVALATFKQKQRDMDVAKIEATVAMKNLRKEAEKRRKLAAERKTAKQREVQAKLEAKSAARDAMVKKAQALMGAKGGTETQGMLGPVSLGIMVDVLMSLPLAVENPIFLKRLNRSKNDIVGSVQDFLNMTRRKTAKFVLASSKASDVELSFLMARYFHEASFRVKAMQSDAEKIARDLNVVMPRELRQSFLPIIKQLRANAVPLRVNASSLASASLSEACFQISGLMGNISNYNSKLSTMHTALHNVWQISELMLPHMSKIYPMKTVVIDTVKDFMSLATTQVAGLQESADEIVTNVGPVVAERMQCTWSSARARSGLGMAAAAAVLAAYLSA